MTCLQSIHDGELYPELTFSSYKSRFICMGMRIEKVMDAGTQNVQLLHIKFQSVKVIVWCTLMVRGIMNFLALWRYN